MSIHGIEYRTPTELIGLSFKRKKYGLSEWTDVITNVKIVLEYNSKIQEYCPTCYVYNNKQIPYDLNDIAILNIRRKVDLRGNLINLQRDGKE